LFCFRPGVADRTPSRPHAALQTKPAATADKVRPDSCNKHSAGRRIASAFRKPSRPQRKFPDRGRTGSLTLRPGESDSLVAERATAQRPRTNVVGALTLTAPWATSPGCL